jgi:hypothetical protein
MPLDANGNHTPYNGFAGNLARALRPFPQYNDIAWRNLADGTSTYHSLQAKMDKRFSNGLQFRVAYVWSKMIVTGPGDSGNAQDGLGGGIQNPLCTRSCERGVSTDDVPHTFILAYTYSLPFGHGKKFGANAPAVVDKLVGGWGLSGIQRYQSGRPLGITQSGGDLTSWLFTNKRYPNKLSDAVFSGGKFDPSTDLYLDRSGWQENPTNTLLFGNAPRMDSHVRTFPIYNEDISLFKDTTFMGERMKMRFEAQFGNIFNRTFYCNPNTNISSGDFGKVTSQCNIPRRIQFGLRFEF